MRRLWVWPSLILGTYFLQQDINLHLSLSIQVLNGYIVGSKSLNIVSIQMSGLARDVVPWAPFVVDMRPLQVAIIVFTKMNLLWNYLIYLCVFKGMLLLYYLQSVSGAFMEERGSALQARRRHFQELWERVHAG